MGHCGDESTKMVKVWSHSHTSETNFDVRLWVGSHMRCSRCFWRHFFPRGKSDDCEFFFSRVMSTNSSTQQEDQPDRNSYKSHYCSAHLARTFTYEEPTTQSIYSTISRAEPLSAQYSIFNWEQNQIYRYLPSVSADHLNSKPAVAELKTSSKVTYTGFCTCCKTYILSPWICSSCAMRQKIRSASSREQDRLRNHWPDSCTSLSDRKYKNQSCCSGTRWDFEWNCWFQASQWLVKGVCLSGLYSCLNQSKSPNPSLPDQGS